LELVVDPSFEFQTINTTVSSSEIAHFVTINIRFIIMYMKYVCIFWCYTFFLLYILYLFWSLLLPYYLPVQELWMLSNLLFDIFQKNLNPLVIICDNNYFLHKSENLIFSIMMLDNKSSFKLVRILRLITCRHTNWRSGK
jgi:hypothetical protein